MPDDVVVALLRNGDYTVQHSGAASQPQTVVTDSADQTYIAPSTSYVQPTTYVSSAPVYSSYDYGYPYYSSYYGYGYPYYGGYGGYGGLYLEEAGYSNGHHYDHHYSGYHYGNHVNHYSNSGVSSGYRYGSAVNGSRFTSNTGSARSTGGATYYSGRASSGSAYRGSSVVSSGSSHFSGGGSRGRRAPLPNCGAGVPPANS